MERLKLNTQKFASSSMSFANGNMLVLLNWSSSVIGSTPAEKAQNNKSGVGADIYVMRTDSYYTTGNFTGHININGVGFGFDTYGTARNGQWLHLGSAYLEVGHNSNGTKKCYIGGVVTGPTETSWEGKTASGGQDVTLDTISRMSSIDSFVGLADGSGRTNNIEGTFKINLTRYNLTFTDDLVIQYLNGNSYTTLKTINGIEDGDTFTFTNSELQTLFASNTTGNTIGLKVYLNTNAGESLIGSSNSIDFTANIYDANPTFSDFTFADINNKTLALTNDSTKNVNGYSNIRITIPIANKAIAKKGASIVKYKVIIGNQTIDIPYSDSSSVSDHIDGSTSGTYQVYAIDSRGNSTLATKLATAEISYSDLTRNTNYSATRDVSGVGGNVTISFSGTIWNGNFGSQSNSFTSAKYLFKKTDSNQWIDLEDLGITPTDITPTINGNNYSFEGLIRSNNSNTKWDLESSYEIKIILEDKLSTIEFVILLSSAIPNISLSRNGVGIMCDYDESLGGVLQINGEVYVSAGKLYEVLGIETDNWSSSNTYSKGDTCLYNNKIYYNLTGNNTSTPPDTDTTNWEFEPIIKF